MSERIVYQALRAPPKLDSPVSISRAEPERFIHTGRRHVLPSVEGRRLALRSPSMGGLELKRQPISEQGSLAVEEAERIFSIREELAGIIRDETKLDPDTVKHEVGIQLIDGVLPIVPFGTMGTLGKVIIEEVVLTAMERPNVNVKKTAKEIAIAALIHLGLQAAIALSAFGL